MTSGPQYGPLFLRVYSSENVDMLPLVLQQDGAPSHRAANTINFLQRENILFIEPKMWPPNSPDLNPHASYQGHQSLESGHQRGMG